MVTDNEAELASGFTPKNTTKINKWAVDNYQQWQEWRNTQHPQDSIPSCSELLTSGDIEMLNKWLARYSVETCGETGRQYPPATIHSLLCGLQ